ncbi:Hint domain-containing protein [Lentibacter algarum]|uniref:Hint domain-containing protein n=1 Tax=Lentibacter algarum TaxID=576131 RepID=UPI001C071C23|nr:Hint domain-containing protein [Lentibacter algarum]MBU2981489.1 Hint domain-containing protein [Lentibacter algarum]
MTQPFIRETSEFLPVSGNAVVGQTLCLSFEASTRIATAMGEVPVCELWRGDNVLTYDGGAEPVLWAGQREVCGKGSDAPVLFTPGTIGNFAPLRLAPQHRVLVVSPQAELLFGHSEVLVPAKALVDGRGVCFAPCERVSYVHILLRQHTLVFAEGASCESLLPSEGMFDIVEPRLQTSLPDYRAVRPVLSYTEALTLGCC